MGKLANRTTIKTARVENFVYTPPEAAFGAARILVKPNLGYPVRHPATVSMPVLLAVLRGLRRASPLGRILIVEGVTGKMPVQQVYEYHGLPDLIDRETRLADAEDLVMKEFPNLNPQPVRYATLTAPAYIEEFDCAISVSTFKRTTLHDEHLYSASLKNLYGLFPRALYHGRSPYARGQLHRPGVPLILRDVYFTIGHHFDGAVVDLTAKYLSPDWKPDRTAKVAHPVGQVVWGDDLLAVDEAAARIAGEPIPEYIHEIKALRREIMGR